MTREDEIKAKVQSKEKLAIEEMEVAALLDLDISYLFGQFKPREPVVAIRRRKKEDLETSSDDFKRASR